MPDSRIKQFEAFLSNKGLRLSNERRLIPNLVFSRSGPFDTDGIQEAVTKLSPARRVSRATVCRTLHLLEESGLVRLN